MSKENICHYHYKILTKADEILKIKDNSYEIIDNFLHDVQSLANDIYPPLALFIDSCKS